MKIDCHIHITPPDIIANWEKYEEKEPYFHMLSKTPHNKFATYEDVVSHLKLNNFNKGIVFGFAFKDAELCKYVNEYTIEAVKKNPEELIGFMVVNPKDNKMSYEIEHCYKNGLMGIGELFPQGQNLNLENLHNTDLKSCCLKFNIPLLLHANETVGHYYAGKTDISLKSLEIFIKNHQELSIILAHFGGGILFYELMKEIRESFKNVYYDSSASIFLYDKEIYNVLREIKILDKIFFGSDYPLLPINKYYDSLSCLNSTEKDKILGNNLVKLLTKHNIL